MSKFNWDWVKDYVDLGKANSQKLSDLMSLRALEVDEVTDNYIDIDVTPNRASDCLSHWGIANEYSSILEKDIKLAWENSPTLEFEEYQLIDKSEGFVKQFSVAVVEGVVVQESPDWLKDRLQTVGLKPINLLVDLTNYVMLDIGQPMHAYDLDKLPTKELGVRKADEGEKLDLLDGQTHTLKSGNYLIIDSENHPLGLAGVKGGASSSITDATTSILIEAANFDPAKTRSSGNALGIRTDALKRFENELAVDWAEIAIERYVELLHSIQPKAKVTYSGSLHPSASESSRDRSVVLKLNRINSLLGVELSMEEVVDILDRIKAVYEENSDTSIKVHPPFYRLDLNIERDWIEEIGRLYGYENINEKTLDIPDTKVSDYDLYTVIRNNLVDLGLSEVQTYSLVKKGDIKTLKPLASDKGALRENIIDQLADSLVMNARNAELFGNDQVCIFEVGSVFPVSGEEKHLAIALSGKQKITNKKLEVIKEKLKEIDEKLVANWNPTQVQGGVVVEVSLAEILIDKRAEVPQSSSATFNQFSNQPFTTRDISVWVNDGSKEDLENLISDNAGENLLSYRLVDEFAKDGKTSLTYRLVFQHPEKTLTDEEVNSAMEDIYNSLGDKYQLR